MNGRILGLIGCAALIACSADTGDRASTTTASITNASQLSGGGMPSGSYVLTFDDGPGERTEEIANWLGDRGIVATFFMNGRNAAGHEAAMQAVTARGHILANHTQNHEDMRTQRGGALYRAVADTDAIIAQYQAGGPWLLRAPYGSWDSRVSGELDGTDMGKYTGSIFWDVGGELTARHGADWDCWGRGLAVEDCAERYMNEMTDRESGIILMHDIHSQSVDMAKLIVESTAGRARFVSITSAPEVRRALGLGSDAGLPDVASPPAGCGDVTYAGSCAGEILTWCEDSVLETADCTAKGKRCALESADTGYNCVD
jgi:peptidoglycan/xylan/chitin deacetylase (PgdA/CDA1 family)